MFESNMETPKSPKETAWENKQKEIEDWGDRKGLGIDEKVKEAVVAFNMSGLPTGESCKGHLERGTSAPWVGVEAPDRPEERFIGENQTYEKVAAEYGITPEDVKTSQNDEAHRKARNECSQSGETPEFEQWRQKNQELMKKAEELLAEFYKDRQVPENLKLEILEGAESGFRIHNGGEDYDLMTEGRFEKLTEEQKSELSQRLEQYRGELKEFAEFLKKKYFENV